MAGKKILALILAGGTGGRMELLTDVRAKPAVPYAGVYRLIDFPLSNCVHSGLSDVWVIEQYEPQSLNDHLANGRPWDLDRTYGGLRVFPPYQGKNEGGGWHQGNADALYRNRHFIREFDPELVLVLSADHIYKLDYREVIDRHTATGADVTMVTTQVPIEGAGRHGTVKVDGEGKVTEFKYKPEAPDSDVVTTEVFVYNPEKLLGTMEALASKDGDGEGESLQDFGNGLIPRLVQGGKAYEYRLEGYWKDVGTVHSYWEAHMDLLAPAPALDLDDPEWPILTLGVQRPPAHIAGSASIQNSLISAGCKVRGKVERSVLAPGVIVEEGATVRDSVILHDTVVSAGAKIEYAVVDQEVRIGAEARVGSKPQSEDGKEDSPLGPENLVLLGCNAEVSDDARVSAGERVEAGKSQATGS